MQWSNDALDALVLAFFVIMVSFGIVAYLLFVVLAIVDGVVHNKREAKPVREMKLLDRFNTTTQVAGRKPVKSQKSKERQKGVIKT